MPKVKPQPVTSVSTGNGTIALDTLATENDAVKVVLFNDNSWRYIRVRSAEDWEVDTYAKHWDTVKLFPYEDVKLADLPESVVIELVDSLKGYHYPIKGTVRSKFGPRGRHRHRGVDIPLKTGDPIYATFSGKVRISTYNKGGYGNLVVIR
ncbi:MAG: peptidoglycan DD-metalloendopeptidase family protein, partial [Rikenellaceae bacterium]|nr:peptidoglycan DD-metalloendopeptidase family protein [Rikenellaceae bacterium]